MDTHYTAVNHDSSTRTAHYISDTSTISTFEYEEFKRLNKILSTSEQLAFFQTYLQNIHAHESLLFMEALSELRHEKSTSQVESIVNRIWKTFLAADAPLELNVKNKESVGNYIQSHKWGIMSKKEAIDVFKEVELEVKIFLNEKILEFDKIYNPEKIMSVHDSSYNKYQKKVVIIGGGFTGFTVASILDSMPRFHVTLIDAKDSFEYTPGMIKLLVKPEETSSLRVRHNVYIKNGRVIIGYADQIINDAKAIKVNDECVPFDYLVIATGSTYKSKLKSFDTSSLYRLSELCSEHSQLKKAHSVLIIGGGLVGCELASEIATHLFPLPFDEKKKITLIDSHDSLVQRSSIKQQTSALNYLKQLGVQVILNEKIVDFDSEETNSYLGSSGTRYSGYDKVFLATGTTPCSDILQGDGDVGFESCVDHWGRLRVKSTLQLDHWKYKHIFAGGDVTNVVEEKTGYAATLAGVCIARNICRLEKGKAPLSQGSKGTLPAPSKPLHGIESQGGIGRQQLSSFERTFAFLNPTWAALKYFDEKEFLSIVQGEAKFIRAAIGKKPRRLDLPDLYYMHNPPSEDIEPFTMSSVGGQDLLLQVPATNLSGSDMLSSDEENKYSRELCNPSPSTTWSNEHPKSRLSLELACANFIRYQRHQIQPSTEKVKIQETSRRTLDSEKRLYQTPSPSSNLRY
ncbi:MAG: hypothetical protein EXX96DRAFT_546179 [Benjaminiella poitrasii]|nr:MAG: hypothetical protein EXX96DRAFT_546179 [Benjaminiella poitrasii]